MFQGVKKRPECKAENATTISKLGDVGVSTFNTSMDLQGLVQG
jgi:hypothetical protein